MLQVASLEKDAPGHVASFHMAYLQHDPNPHPAARAGSTINIPLNPDDTLSALSAAPYDQQPSTHSSVLPQHSPSNELRPADTAMREARLPDCDRISDATTDVPPPQQPPLGGLPSGSASAAASNQHEQSAHLQEHHQDDGHAGPSDIQQAPHVSTTSQHKEASACGHEHRTTDTSTHSAEAAAAVIPKVTFLYRVAPGVADRSFGLNVARMAHLPAEVVTRAAMRASDMELTTLQRIQKR